MIGDTQAVGRLHKVSVHLPAKGVSVAAPPGCGVTAATFSSGGVH